MAQSAKLLEHRTCAMERAVGSDRERIKKWWLVRCDVVNMLLLRLFYMVFSRITETLKTRKCRILKKVAYFAMWSKQGGVIHVYVPKHGTNRL